MILEDVSIQDADDPDDEILMVFHFDQGNLAFECPIAATHDEVIAAMRAFLDTAEGILKSQTTFH